MIREDIQRQTPQTTFGTAVAPITVTPRAGEMLQEAMHKKSLEGASLRVFVSGGGCSGLQYGMAFETESGADDHVFEAAGLTVLVDPTSVQYLQGCNIDYEDSLMGGGFKIDNPNAVSSCGCGSSFRTSGTEAGAGDGSGTCSC